MATQIFISYRREGGIRLAMHIYDRLQNEGYDCFLDKHTLKPGKKFPEEIYTNINECTDFLLVLPPGGLDNCKDEEDWVRKEIEYALEKNKNIIPFLEQKFEFPQKADLPEKLRAIPDLEAIRFNDDYLEAVMEKLTDALESKPIKNFDTDEISESKTGNKNISAFIKVIPIIVFCIIASFFLPNIQSPAKVDFRISIGSDDEIKSDNIISHLQNLTFDDSQSDVEETENIEIEDIDNESPRNFKLATINEDELNFENYLKEAENGDTDAMLDVALCYYVGKGVSKDLNKGFEWAKKSAEKGNSNAMLLIGASYTENNELKKIITTVFEYYLQDDEEDLSDSSSSSITEYDPNQSLEDQFTEKDDFNPEVFIGKLLIEDTNLELNIEKNDKKAFTWYLKSAEAGNTGGMYIVARSYANGIGVEKNKEKSQKWFNNIYEELIQDVDFYVSEDLLRLGNFYLTKYFLGINVEESGKNAFKYFSKCADSRNNFGILCTGICHYQGIGTIQNYEKAFELFSELARDISNRKVRFYDDTGNFNEQHFKIINNSPLKKLAIFIVGKCYADGKGVSQDYNKAFEYFKKSAELGYTEAMANVGAYYWQGKGVEKDYDQAFYWCLKAAESGNVTAMNTVGKIYYLDTGSHKDYERAVFWFEKAANSGNIDAMKNLAIMYINGEGVPKNEKKAKEWQQKYEQLQK